MMLNTLEVRLDSLHIASRYLSLKLLDRTEFSLINKHPKQLN